MVILKLSFVTGEYGSNRAPTQTPPLTSQRLTDSIAYQHEPTLPDPKHLTSKSYFKFIFCYELALFEEASL